jgi:hypothetical protein
MNNEAPSVVAVCVCNRSRPWPTTQQRQFLEQPEEFEDDHDNDNHSNDVKDVSVHAGDSYQSECAVASVIQTERLPEYAVWEIHPVLALRDSNGKQNFVVPGYSDP